MPNTLSPLSRPIQRLAVAILLLGPLPLHAAGIRDAESCAAAIAADPDAAREEAAVWTRLGGGTAAELCEAAALEALGAYGTAAARLSDLAADRRRAHPLALRVTLLADAARLWLAAARPDLAAEALAAADRLAPPDPDRLRLAAEIAAATADWPAALAALDALVAAEPGAEPQALRAAALRRAGDLPAARAAAAAALALDPDLPAALFEAGAAAAESADPAAARTAWHTLIARHPDDPLATFARRNLAALD